MTGYFPSPTRAMPTQVKVLRVILYVVGAATLLFLAAAIVVYPNAREVGQTAGMPFILGLAGAGLALLIKPGRLAVRIGIIIVEVFWLLIALGRLGQGDPTGVFAMILPIAMLILVNLAPVRRYFSRTQAS